MGHQFQCRVYHEDVDQGGIVYHSNYLKFAERARTEWLRTLGFDHPSLWAQERASFVVTQVAVRYLKPASLDDHLAITSGPVQIQGIRLIIPQIIQCQEMLYVDMTVTLVLINDGGKPRRIPTSILHSFLPHAI